MTQFERNGSSKDSFNNVQNIMLYIFFKVPSNIHFYCVCLVLKIITAHSSSP